MKLRHLFYKDGSHTCVAFYLSGWEKMNPPFHTKDSRSDGLYAEILLPPQFAVLMDVEWVKVESGELACYRYIEGARNTLLDLTPHISIEQRLTIEAEISMVEL